MLEPLGRCCRDSTLFQLTSNRLRDFIDPNHLLIQIYEQLDFAKLVAPLEGRYCPGSGRHAFHPKVIVRALLICSIYNRCLLPQIVFGHLREYRISLILLPHRR